MTPDVVPTPVADEALAGLTQKEQRFVAMVCRGAHYQAAAKVAGFPATATADDTFGVRLASQRHIKQAIQKYQALQRLEFATLRDRVLHALIEDAFFDPGEAFDADGIPLPVPAMPLSVRQRLSAVRPGKFGVTLEFQSAQRAKEKLLDILGVGQGESRGLTININLQGQDAPRSHEKPVGPGPVPHLTLEMGGDGGDG